MFFLHRSHFEKLHHQRKLHGFRSHVQWYAQHHWLISFPATCRLRGIKWSFSGQFGSRIRWSILVAFIDIRVSRSWSENEPNPILKLWSTSTCYWGLILPFSNIFRPKTRISFRNGFGIKHFRQYSTLFLASLFSKNSKTISIGLFQRHKPAEYTSRAVGTFCKIETNKTGHTFRFSWCLD